MSGFPWWVWIVLAGVLALAEMGAPSSYLIWIALGAAVTGIADATTGLLLEGQLAVFAVATSVSCIAGYFVYGLVQRRERTGERPLNEPHRAMLGARGTVCEAFLNGRGKVRIGDTVWLATGPDLAEGAPVVVSGVRGTRLVVEGLRAKAAASNGTVPSG